MSVLDYLSNKENTRRDNPPSIIDNTNRNARMINSLASMYKTGFTHLGDPNEFAEYNVQVNPVDSEEDLKRHRAENQSAFEQLSNVVVQAVGNEVVLGTFLGLSNLVDAAANLFTEEGESDYTNPVSTYLESLQDDIRNKFEIYEKNPGETWQIGDFGWWANNSVSIASTASMLIPSTGVVKGVSALGKIANVSQRATRLAARATKAITKADKSVERLSKSIGVGTEIASSAFLSRTMEGYLEARSVYNEVRDNVLHRIQDMTSEDKQNMLERNPQFAGKTDEEIANYIAGASADETFRNDYAMLLMDIVQFKAISGLWKGVKNKSATAKLRTENKKALKTLVGESVDDATKAASKSPWLKNRIDRINEAINHPLTTVGAIEWSEGFEEGYQGIQTERGKEVAEMILNPNYTPRTINSYLTDGSIWEQAVWGILGGMGFQAAGKGLGALYKKGEAYYKHKTGKLSDEDYAKSMTAEEKMRSAEINDRISYTRKFVESMQLLNNRQNPYAFKIDAVTGEKLKVDGVEQHEGLSLEEAEILKTKTINDYIATMTMNSIDAGNFDLFKEFVSNPEFDQYFKAAGLELNVGDKNFNEQLLEQSEEIANNYETFLYNVLSVTEIENESVARIAAREFTREILELNDISHRYHDLYNKIMNLTNNNIKDVHALEDKRTVEYVKQQLNLIDKRQDELQKDYDNNKISFQAKQQYEKDYNIRRRSLSEVLSEITGVSDEVLKDIEKVLNLSRKDAQNFNSEFYKLTSILESVITNNDVSLPKSVTDLIDKRIGLSDSYEYLNIISPVTTEDYKERVDEISQQVDSITKKRMSDAAKKVEDYIIKQKDLQKAYADILNNNVPELKNELDILKIGYHTTDDYTTSIKATIAEEERKRKIEREKTDKTIINGSTATPQQKQQIKKNIDATVNNAVTDESDSNSSPSTGNDTKASQQTKKPLEEIAAKAVIPQEVIQSLDKATETAIKQTADAYKMTIEETDVDKAMYATINLYKTSSNLFNDALGKDINSVEFQRIVDLVSEELFKKGVDANLTKAAALRGVRMGLNIISHRLSSKKDSKAEEFKKLAGSIAIKHQINIDNASLTTSLNDAELNAVIDEFLKVYSEFKDIATPDGQKIIINLENLFDDIINNKEIDIDVDTAMHILWNIKDYINNPLNSKYIFTHKRELNSILKNPAEFFNSVMQSKSKEVQLDNYMHIAASSSKDIEYVKRVAALQGGEDVEISYIKTKQGNNSSISFRTKDGEIGYISTVTPHKDNRGYQVNISERSGGIVYDIRESGDGNYVSNTDELFNEILNTKGKLWEIINKQYRYLLGGSRTGINVNEVNDFLNNDAVKNAIAKGVIILPKKWDDTLKHLVPALTTDTQKAQWIINKLTGVIFYDNTAQSGIELRNSYKQWLKNAFINYRNTHKIQTALDKNEKVITKFANTANTYQGANDIKTIITDTEQSISDIGLTYDRNPIVGVVHSEGNTMLINEKTGKAVVSAAPFTVGSMGMLIGGRESTPILAMFTSANKLGNTIKKQLADELTDILKGFQTSKYNFEDVADKLSALFNGPGINNPTVFQGYSVIKDGNTLALSVGGKLKEYVLVINKFKKDSTETGTGIIYAPNGNRDKAMSSIAVNDKFINKIVTEISDNVVYNRTFYTLDNVGIDNTSDNPYMYKENGKFVIELGGTKTLYDSFGDFVLKENAFNTNQGRNEYGGYFDNTDKVNSLYIDVAVLEAPTSKTLPVEGEEYKSVADTIKSATIDKFNDTKELLEKVGIDEEQINYLMGDNIYGIDLVPNKYGFDYKLTNESAVYRNGKIYFGRQGANEANNSPFTLKRLLIHEHLHNRLNEHKLLSRNNIVNNLLDTYNATIKAIDNIIKTANPDSAEYKNAVNVRNWINDNKFDPVNYFSNFSKEKQEAYANKTEEQRAQIFAEEWLVESITQPMLMNFLNNTEYAGKVINVEGIAEEHKSIFQKIIDLLLKIFGKGRTNVKNNTIFAQQYILLSNVETTDNTIQTIEKAENVDETSDNATEQVEQASNDITDEYNENNDIGDSVKLESTVDESDEELLSITTSAETYVEEEKNILNNAPRDSKGRLLAPNGKPSNLTEKQYAQVRTKEFINWFGDWINNPENASKVVDENGEPLVVYHNTDATFNEFDKKLIGKNYKGGMFGKGFYFSNNDSYTEIFGENKMAVFLNIKKPLTKEQNFNDFNEYIIASHYYTMENVNLSIFNGKYDGIIGNNDSENAIEYVVENSNQIKSATDNIGTFNKTDNNIYHSVTTSAEEFILDHISDDGGATAETFGVTRVTNMADYLNMFEEQDKPLVAKMIANGEIKYACR